MAIEHRRKAAEPHHIDETAKTQEAEPPYNDGMHTNKAMGGDMRQNIDGKTVDQRLKETDLHHGTNGTPETTYTLIHAEPPYNDGMHTGQTSEGTDLHTMHPPPQEGLRLGRKMTLIHGTLPV